MMRERLLAGPADNLDNAIDCRIEAGEIDRLTIGMFSAPALPPFPRQVGLDLATGRRRVVISVECADDARALLDAAGWMVREFEVDE